MESALKKRGQHKRARKFPGIKGRRPDRKAARKAVADANHEATQARLRALNVI